MAATFFYMTSSMMGTPIIAGFSQSLGASGALMGFLAGALSLSALICRPIAGNLSDRTSKRKLAVIGALIFLASNLGYYFVPNTAWLLAARILNGVGFACISVCLSTWLSMLLPISRMGAGMGLYGTMNALAQAVGPDLGIRASKAIGYRNTFLIAVGLTCCIVICVLLIKDGGKPPRARLGRQQGGERHHIRLDSLFEPRVIPIALIFMLFAIPYFANQSFIVDYANARHAHVIVSLFFPCYAITLLISRIVLRNWFDTKSFLFFMVTGTICQIVMLASLTVMRNNWFVMLAGLATVGAYGMMSSVTQRAPCSSPARHAAAWRTRHTMRASIWACSSARSSAASCTADCQSSGSTPRCCSRCQSHGLCTPSHTAPFKAASARRVSETGTARACRYPIIEKHSSHIWTRSLQ